MMERSVLQEVLRQFTAIRNDPEKLMEIELIVEKKETLMVVSMIAYHEECTIWDDTDSDDDSSSSDEQITRYTYEFCIQVCIGTDKRQYKQFDEQLDLETIVEEYVWSELTSDGVIPKYLGSRCFCEYANCYKNIKEF